MLLPRNVLRRCSALVVCLGLGCVLAAQDAVRLRNGSTEAGRIESEGYDGLVLKTKDGKQEKQLKLTWDQIAQVSYGGAAEYTQAVNEIASGNVGSAIPKLAAMAKNASLRKELRPHVLFQLAAAQQRAGKLAEAAAGYADLVKEFPKTQHLAAAASGLVECYTRLNDTAGGLTALEALIDGARKGGVGEDYLGAFDYFRGLLLEAKKDLVAAKVKYESAAAVRSGPPELVQGAKLGIARCEQEDGHVDQARTAYKALLESDAGNEVLAGAWNGLADMARAEAAKASNAAKLVDALFMYLRGVVEYGPAPGEGTGEYERALAGAAAVFKQLSDLETDDARKKQYAQRARQRLDQLKKEFPNSRYLEGN